jgi:site-specific recombinase XerD
MPDSDEKPRSRRGPDRRVPHRPRRVPARPRAVHRRPRTPTEADPDLAALVGGALQSNPGLRRYARYLAVLLDGLPAYTPVIRVLADRSFAYGPPVPAMPGLGQASPGTVTTTHLQDLQRALGRYAATMKLQQAAEHGHQLLSYDPDAHGHGAQRDFRDAVRAVFGRADVRQWTTGNPAQKLKLPARGADHAYHLTATQYLAWLAIACITGHDRELDRLVLLTLRHTALRQEALLNLTVDAIDVLECRLRASTKNGRIQWLPVNRRLLEELLALARARGAHRGWDPVFRCRNGTPMTGRRFDALTVRLKRYEPWAAPLTIGPHAIRRLTLDEVENRFGLAIASSWAGHSWRSRGTIFAYLRQPTAEELRPVAEALFGPLDGPLRTSPIPAVDVLATSGEARSRRPGRTAAPLTAIPRRTRGAQP